MEVLRSGMASDAITVYGYTVIESEVEIDDVAVFNAIMTGIIPVEGVDIAWDIIPRKNNRYFILWNGLHQTAPNEDWLDWNNISIPYCSQL